MVNSRPRRRRDSTQLNSRSFRVIKISYSTALDLATVKRQTLIHQKGATAFATAAAVCNDACYKRRSIAPA